MASNKTQFVCNVCGNVHHRWAGQCPACKAWNSMVEELAVVSKPKGKGRAESWTGGRSQRMDLSEVDATQSVLRWSSGLGELDRALGGGIVPGSVVLLGGDPGIGKSTLLLQMVSELGKVKRKPLYVTGEESLEQVAARSLRLGLSIKGVHALAETSLEAILHSMKSDPPDVVVLDSIQTLYSEQMESAPGTVSQVRECAAQVVRVAKQQGIAVFLIGHVTKEGTIAGPRVLEHMVDTVLYFEGDPQSPYRLVRALKNRFGSVHEIGAFEMLEQGLRSVDNPSAMFLAAGRKALPGACVFVMQDGPRPILLEVQALMDECAGPHPKRVVVGLDANRLSMILAVLHKHAQVPTASYDVFVNAVGGIRVQDPGSDLPLLLALLTSLQGKSLPTDVACFGELGLTGEVRPVQRAEQRLRDAAAQGFTTAILPARNMPNQPIPGLTLIPVATAAQAVMAAQGLVV